MKPAAGASQNAEDPDLRFTYRVRKIGEIEIRQLIFLGMKTQLYQNANRQVFRALRTSTVIMGRKE